MFKFKCVHTGSLVEVFTEYDADSFRKHSEYTEVREPEVTEEEQPKPVRKKKEQ